METMDFGKNMKDNLPLKPIAIVFLGLCIISILFFVALNILGTAPIAMNFKESEVKAGENTTLFIILTNTETLDAQDVTLKLTAESEVITIHNPQRTEVAIGSKARREFEFDVSVKEGATPGTYKIWATVTGLGETEKMNVGYIGVKKN